MVSQDTAGRKKSSSHPEIPPGAFKAVGMTMMGSALSLSLTTTFSSKVDLHHEIDLRALCGHVIEFRAVRGDLAGCLQGRRHDHDGVHPLALSLSRALCLALSLSLPVSVSRSRSLSLSLTPMARGRST